jgi:toxin FitB
MWLLDTCVISEFVKPRPSEQVLAWLKACDESGTYLSVLTLGEIRSGIERLAAGKRRNALDKWLEGDLRARFEDRILAVSEEVALRWGILHAAAHLAGEKLPVTDALIAATAIVHGMAVVTRNSRDLVRTGVRVVDPWAGAA